MTAALLLAGRGSAAAKRRSGWRYRRGVAVAGGSFNDGTISGGGAMSAATPGVYGTDWFYDVDGGNRTSTAGLEYLAGRFGGGGLIRVDFRWERLQPTLDAALDSAEVARIRAMLDAAAGANLGVILECHNYGHYKLTASDPNATSSQGGYSLGEPELPYASFDDLWERIVAEWGAHSAVHGWEIMNEPTNMAATTGPTVTGLEHWQAASQSAVDAIRATGDRHVIYVGGYGWSSAQTFDFNNGSTAWITDPLGDVAKLRYVAHHYWDGNRDSVYGTEDPAGLSGGTVQDWADTIVAELGDFTGWLTSNGVKGAVTEVGWPDNAASADWNTVADQWLDAADSAELDVTVWATGAAWGDYELAIYEATGLSWHNGDVIDSANTQAATFEAHLAVRAGSAITISATATGLFGFAAPASGARTVDATATGLFGFAAPASGTVTVDGTGTGLFGFAGPASGEVAGATPITFGATLPATFEQTAGTTTVMSYTGAEKPGVGDLVVMMGARDNAAVDDASGDSLNDGHGNTYTKYASVRSSGGAANGVVAVMFACILTTAWSGDQTLTWEHFSVTGRVLHGGYWFDVAGIPAGNPGIGGAADSTTPAGATVTNVASGDLVVGMGAWETRTAITGDADTVNGTWTALQFNATSGGQPATNVGLGWQHKIVTAAGNQTYDQTNASAHDSVLLAATFSAATS